MESVYVTKYRVINVIDYESKEGDTYPEVEVIRDWTPTIQFRKLGAEFKARIKEKLAENESRVLVDSHFRV